MLKSLEIFGFKSFADRTRFDFSTGVTGVVGPNGSGKSNVVDSIKWLLGDQSPKSLRGKEMTDVIFNGSATRKPAGFAEATLTFDNTRRLLSVDADEVSVGRRIYRSGEAEYLVNRLPARLKDVKDLFLGTGAGASAYSIIEQGRVDQLLQATNVNRRIVFEEAAGISRFRAKKVDAERKLERVAQNLLRLSDIVQEVEKQRNNVRSQATRAARYRQLTHELRVLRIGLAADEVRLIRDEVDQLAARRLELQGECDQLAGKAQDYEARQREADAQLTQAEDALREAERLQAEHREAVAGLDATRKHHLTRQQELDADFHRLQNQQEELLDRSRQVTGELEQTVDHLQRFGEEVEQRRARLRDQEAAIGEAIRDSESRRELVEQHRQAMLAGVRKASAYESRVSTLAGHRDNLATERQRVQQRQRKLADQLIQTQDQLARVEADLILAESRLNHRKGDLAGLLTERHHLLEEQAQRQQKLLELREQRGALQARKAVLEDLELRQEGLGVGVKEILARARAAEGPPWNNVLGHVVELLDVELDQAALLEVALGQRAQLIVLDDAAPLLVFLNDGNCRIAGRVGFLAIPDAHAGGADLARGIPASATPVVDLEGQPGVVCRADQLVRSPGPIARLAESLLSDTWIVETLADALRLAATATSPVRFVTRQGELLDSSGVLYVGSVRGETALVSRRSELRGIKTDLQRLDRQTQGEDQARLRASERLTALDAEVESHRSDVDLLTQQANDVRARVTNQRIDIDRLQRDLDDCEADLARNLTELDDTTRRAAEAERELLAEREHLDALQTRLAQVETDVNSGERLLAEQRDALAREQLELAQQEERLSTLASAKTRLDQERLQRDMHRADAQRRFDSITARREQIAQELAETDSRLELLLAGRDEIATAVAEAQEARDAIRRDRGQVNDAEIRERHRLRELRDELHKLDLRETELKHQVTTLGERLHEEYQLDLSDLIAGDQSARGAWDQLVKEHAAARSEETSHGQDEDPFPAAPVEEEALRAAVEERINRARRRLKSIGQVNTESLKELDDLETRYIRLSTQLQDLVEARNTLDEIIRRINTESKRLFIETFEQIRIQFQELFRKLFGGGEGDVLLEDPNDMLECGIEIVARPPGKELRSISLLSGGEKTLTAVALLLAIFQSKPSPFCLLDEVDAALDEGNVERYMNVIREFQKFTQFIVITHNKRTMSAADVLYGITMEEAGVSKRMSVRFDDITEDGNFKTDQSQAA